MIQVQGRFYGSVVENALAYSEPQMTGNQRLRARHEDVVQFPSRLPADHDHVLESFSGQQRCPRALAFKESVGCDSRSMDDFADGCRVNTSNAFQDALFRMLRSG